MYVYSYISIHLVFHKHIAHNLHSKPVYISTAKSHVRAAMEGYNTVTVVFATVKPQVVKPLHLWVNHLLCALVAGTLLYVTQTGGEAGPGIYSRRYEKCMYIKKSPSREFLLRCSCLEIYNEAIHDLLSPSGAPVGLQGVRDCCIVFCSPCYIYFPQAEWAINPFERRLWPLWSLFVRSFSGEKPIVLPVQTKFAESQCLQVGCKE